MNAQNPAFSVRCCDTYLDHLIGVCSEHQLVVATEDIHNEFGVVLLREGTPLGDYVVQRMRGHTLLRPLDELLKLRRILRPADIASGIAEMLEEEPDLHRIDLRYGREGLRQRLCDGLALPAALMQKFTVMQLRLPRVFHRALFTAWFGMLLALVRRMRAEDMLMVFRAALCHDLGLLHIAPALVDKKVAISVEDWDAIRSHALIGSQIVQQSSGGNERLARVVLEHHERNDGAGYPNGIEGKDLDPASLPLALADMLHAQRFQSLVLTGASLIDCMPFLKVNRHTFGKDNYAPAARLLLAAEDSAAVRPRSARAIPVQGLLDVNRCLIALRADISGALPILERLADRRTARSLLNLAEQIEWVALTSGLGNESLAQWLGEALDAGREDPAAADIHATAREVFWLVKRFDRQLKEFLDELAGTPDAIALKDLSLRVSGELTRAWRRFEPGTTAA